MIVLKFGGAALADGAATARVAEVVDRAARDRRVVVVVSAHASVTDRLHALAGEAAAGRGDSSDLHALHRRICHELHLPDGLHDALLSELDDLLRGIALVGEASPRALDHLASFGERLSARTLAATLAQRGLAATAVDAWDAGLRTDSRFGAARPLPDDGRIVRALAAVEGVPVVTGYIAKDEAGNITTLGRNGSDFSAALFGAALGADEIQVWKDVDGVMTADPRVVPHARPVKHLSLAEAAELAGFGGRVLHPATIVPATASGIPVRVCSMRRAELGDGGTWIVAEPEAAGADPVRAIAHRGGVTLLTVAPDGRSGSPRAWMAGAMAACAQHAAAVLLFTASQASATVAVDAGDGPALGAELAAHGRVTTRTGVALLCAVGEGIARADDVAARATRSLAGAAVEVVALSHGAAQAGMVFAVPAAAAEAAVRALHAELIG